MLHLTHHISNLMLQQSRLCFEGLTQHGYCFFTPLITQRKQRSVTLQTESNNTRACRRCCNLKKWAWPKVSACDRSWIHCKLKQGANTFPRKDRLEACAAPLCEKMTAPTEVGGLTIAGSDSKIPTDEAICCCWCCSYCCCYVVLQDP